MRRIRTCAAALTGASLILTAMNAAATVLPQESTFDHSAQSWAGLGDGASDIRYRPTGGNDGGYIVHIDEHPGGATLAAPSNFLGDWSPFDGVAFLEFDLRIMTPSPTGESRPPAIFLLGDGGSARWFGDDITAAEGWTRQRVAIDQAAWEVTGGDWAALVADVDAMLIRMDLFANTIFPGETTGVDNVRLALPLPADFNRDGIVDVLDLGILATQWQQPGTLATGDANADGFVDVTDLGILATDWQQSSQSFAEALDEISFTPEPNAAIAACAAGAAWWVTRRRSLSA